MIFIVLCTISIWFSTKEKKSLIKIQLLETWKWDGLNTDALSQLSSDNSVQDKCNFYGQLIPYTDQ